MSTQLEQPHALAASNEELPELEGAALEELAAEPAGEPTPLLGTLDDPFGAPAVAAPPVVVAPVAESDPLADAPTAPHELGAAPQFDGVNGDPPDAMLAPPMAAAPVVAAPMVAPPVVAAPASPGSVSAKELTDDILGGVDFDLPAQPANAPVVKPVAPVNAPSAKSPAPAGFKPVGQLFGQSGGFGAAGVKPAAPAARPAAPPPQATAQPMVARAPAATSADANIDPRSLFGDMGDLSASAAAAPLTGADPRAALRQALTADTPPAHLPPEAQRLAFHLCRVLVKKGILSIDELLSG